MKHLPHYENDERTRYRVRIEVDHEWGPQEIYWIKFCMDLEEAQRSYIAARDATTYGASRFGTGDVFDEAGQHIARISFNGRLWHPWTNEFLADRPEELIA